MKKMGANKIVILISAGLVALAFVLFLGLNAESRAKGTASSPELIVRKSWELPAALNEVSGIAFLDQDRLAAVQDEQGVIFIYNLSDAVIEKQVRFAGKGDYEGIAIAGNSAYVLRSDGTIFVVRDFLGDNQVREFSTTFTSENDMEGFFYDRKKERLLLAVKMKDPFSEEYKGIYSVSLAPMELQKEPAYKLNFQSKIFGEGSEEDVQEAFFPSEIIRNPSTGNLLVLDGENPRLLLVDNKGEPIRLYPLNEEEFPQPEGLAFDPSGAMYISSEGNPATLHQVDFPEE